MSDNKKLEQNKKSKQDKKLNANKKVPSSKIKLNLDEMERSYDKILAGEMDAPTNKNKKDKSSNSLYKENVKSNVYEKKNGKQNKEKSGGQKEKSEGTREIKRREYKGSDKDLTRGHGKDNIYSKGNSSLKKNINETKGTNRGQKAGRYEKTLKKNVIGQPCIYTSKCGGCNCSDIPYKEQLREKQKKLEGLLKEFCKVEPIIGMEHPYHYRNKVHAVVSHNKGNIITGVYKEGTHIVIPVDQCLIEDVKADTIIGTIRGLMKSFKMKAYDEDNGYGFLRHILIKRGFKTDQTMVVLVTASPIFPSKNNFVKALLKEHPDITTIVQNVNDRNTSMVLGDREVVMYGKGYIEDILCGYRFRISSKSFYQVNPVQTEILYQKAMEFAGLTGKERVIDTYSGIGTIGIVASKYAKEVIGIELNKDAVRDAVANAKINGIKNIEFYQGDSSEFMVKFAEDGEKADVVFLDPPRSGSTEQFMDAVVKLAPERVVYISCNPETLARDLKYMQKKGYKAKVACGVDLFPFTSHVETCVLLSHKNS